MFGWMARNFISRETNVVLKTNSNKTSNRILYTGLGSSIEAWKLQCNIDIDGHTKKSDINNKKRVNDYLQGDIREIRINYFWPSG